TRKKMANIIIRILSLIFLIIFAYPLTLLLHPWWILMQPLGAYDLFSNMINELTTIMHLPENLSLSIQTGQWWWQL
ncbi:unnamed protein product, partial [Rotaria sp. Silwood1]